MIFSSLRVSDVTAVLDGALASANHRARHSTVARASPTYPQAAIAHKVRVSNKGSKRLRTAIEFLKGLIADKGNEMGCSTPTTRQM
jgi:hypothetical protein